MTVGRKLIAELSRRGERGRYFTTGEYWELRRVDSVEGLADFLDRTGFSGVRAIEDVSVVADDLNVEADASDKCDPFNWLGGGAFGLLVLPFSLIIRLFKNSSRPG